MNTVSAKLRFVNRRLRGARVGIVTSPAVSMSTASQVAALRDGLSTVAAEFSSPAVYYRAAGLCSDAISPADLAKSPQAASTSTHCGLAPSLSRRHRGFAGFAAVSNGRTGLTAHAHCEPLEQSSKSRRLPACRLDLLPRGLLSRPVSSCLCGE